MAQNQGVHILISCPLNPPLLLKVITKSTVKLQFLGLEGPGKETYFLPDFNTLHDSICPAEPHECVLTMGTYCEVSFPVG